MFDTKFLLYCLDVAQAVPETMAILDKWLTWGLMELQLGRYMDMDPWGRPLPEWQDGKRQGPVASGWRGILVYHKGDEKYIQRTYKTSHGAVSRNVCIQCHATNTDDHLIYTQHGPNAPHRATRLTTEEFITRVAGIATIITLPGFSVEFLTHDWLHVVDLTIIPEVSASCLVELVKEGVFGCAGTMDERLRGAYVSFRQWCRDAHIRNKGQFFSMPLGLGFLPGMSFFLMHAFGRTSVELYLGS